MADLAASIPTDGDPGEPEPPAASESTTDSATSTEPEASASSSDATNPFDVDSDDASDSKVPDEGYEPLTSDDLDPDGLFTNPIDASDVMDTEIPLTSDDLDPDGVFTTPLDDSDVMDTEIPLTSDDLDPDGVFTTPLHSDDSMNTEVDADPEACEEPSAYEDDVSGSRLPLAGRLIVVCPIGSRHARSTVSR